MRDENQCLHGRDAHAPLAFASHTLSSHFRISEIVLLSECASRTKMAARTYVMEFNITSEPSCGKSPTLR